MIDTTAPTSRQVRVYCEDTGKLIATIDEQGIHVYCIYQRRPELVPKDVCMAVWVPQEQAGQEVCEENEQADIAL